jgi:hypothetical protein
MEQADLDNIKLLIQEKFRWGDTDEWTNFHFKELKKAIEEATGDNISEETLKRIFGKRKKVSNNYQPQAYTQLALLKYADSLQPLSSHEEDKKPKAKRSIRWAISIVGSIVLIIFIVVVIGKQNDQSFSFKCTNPVDISPYTASFNYDISNIEDSVFVNFGFWKENYLSPKNHLITAFYKIPGVYTVRLYTRSKLLGTQEITAYSTDWQGGYFPNRQDSLFEPFINQSFFRQDDYFYAHSDYLFSKERVDLKQKFYTSYRFFSPFNISLDSLSLETRVLNNATTGSMLCYDTGLRLVGDLNTIDFNFTQQKCSRYAGIKVSEKELSGEFADLSALAIDMSDWLNIKVKNEKNVFHLYLSNQLIYKQEYKKPLGKLIGIVVYFSGTGKLDDIKLYDSNQSLFYTYDFNNYKDRVQKK